MVARLRIGTRGDVVRVGRPPDDAVARDDDGGRLRGVAASGSRARVYEPETGRVLEVLSTEEGIVHSRMWHGIFDKIEFGRVPVVTVMHGAVIGGGDVSKILGGAAIGAAAGTVISLGTGEVDAVLPAGSKMTLQTTQQVTL